MVSCLLVPRAHSRMRGRMTRGLVGDTSCRKHSPLQWLWPLVMLSALTHAEDGVADYRNLRISSADNQKPGIVITINREARISAVLTGPLPTGPCGAPLDFHPAPLQGLPEEARDLRITMRQAGPVDITIAFRAHNQGVRGDLGGRDRAHFLLRCEPKSAASSSPSSNNLRRTCGKAQQSQATPRQWIA